VRSLQTKVILFVSLLILLTTVSIGAIFTMNSRSVVTETIGAQALSVAEYARTAVDAAEFVSITPENGETEAYRALRAKLNEIRVANGLKYLYTMRAVEVDGQTQYQYVVDGMPLDSEDASGLGEVEENQFPGMVAVFETGEPFVGSLDYSADYGWTLSTYIPIKDEAGNVVGALGADYDAGRIAEVLSLNERESFAVSVAVLLVALVAAYFLARSIVSPLRKLTASLSLVGQGDLTSAFDVSRKDEIGRLAEAFRQTVSDLRTLIRQIQTNAVELRGSAERLQGNSETAERVTNRIRDAIQEAADGSETQLQRFVEASRSLEEVATGIQRVAENAAAAAEAASGTEAETDRGNATVANVIRRMEQIRETSETMASVVEAQRELSKQIGDIVGAITSIAAQTNILALNAGIEAARAGEHGRGFSVVAGEIRKLAEQTTASSAEIARMIDAVQRETERAVQAMDINAAAVREGQDVAAETERTFAIIASHIQDLMVRIEDMSSVSQQIAAGAEQVTASMDEVADISKSAAKHYSEVASASDEQTEQVAGIAGAAETLNRMAADLGEQVRRFKTE